MSFYGCKLFFAYVSWVVVDWSAWFFVVEWAVAVWASGSLEWVAVFYDVCECFFFDAVIC